MFKWIDSKVGYISSIIVGFFTDSVKKLITRKTRKIHKTLNNAQESLSNFKKIRLNNVYNAQLSMLNNEYNITSVYGVGGSGGNIETSSQLDVILKYIYSCGITCDIKRDYNSGVVCFSLKKDGVSRSVVVGSRFSLERVTGEIIDAILSIQNEIDDRNRPMAPPDVKW